MVNEYSHEVNRSDQEDVTNSHNRASAQEQELVKKLAERDSKIGELERKILLYETSGSWLMRAISYVSIGPGLSTAIDQWRLQFRRNSSKSLVDRIPREESFEVISAYLRRRAATGLMVAIFAIVPSLVTVYLLWQQNFKIDQQIFLTAANRAQDGRRELVEIVKDIDAYTKTSCLKELDQAVPRSFRSLSRTRQAEQKGRWELTLSHCWSDQSFANALSKREWLERWNSEAVYPNVLNSTETVLGQPRISNYKAAGSPADYLVATSLPLVPSLEAQIQTLASSLPPYRFMLDSGGANESPGLSSEAYSPERGAILRALGIAKVSIRGIDASRAWSPNADLAELNWDGVSLSSSSMECTNFQAGRFTKVDFSQANFQGVDFRDSDLRSDNRWEGSDLRHARFERAILPSPERFDPKSIAEADFHGALVPGEDWHERLPTRLRHELNVGDYVYTRVPHSDLPVGTREGIATANHRYWLMQRRDARALASAQNDISEYCNSRLREGFRFSNG